MITIEDVIEIARENVDSRCTVEPINDGVNSNFAIETETKEYVAKFGTFDHRSVYVEPYLIRRLDKHGLLVPSVRVIGEHRGIPYFIADRLHGEQLAYPQELSTDDLLDATPKIGEFLGRMQEIECGVGQLYVENDDLVAEGDEWEQFYRQTIDQFVWQAKGNYPDLGSRAANLAERMEIPTIERSVLCPLDLHTRNIFLSDDGSIDGVIDFERVYGGHPGWAFAVSLHTLRADRSEEEREAIEAQLASGYKRARNFVPERHPAFVLVAILREMRAAQLWWKTPSDRRHRLGDRLDEIEADLIER